MIRFVRSWGWLSLLSLGCAHASSEEPIPGVGPSSAAACGQAAACSSGTVCEAGRCVPVALALDPNAGSGGGSVAAPAQACVHLDVGFENRRATVLLLVDQSGSMFDQPYPVGAASNRWSVLHTALMDPTLGAVKRVEGAVRMGLSLYTAHVTPLDTACPRLVNVPIALDNHAAIDAAYAAATRGEDTPTGDAINAVLPALAAEPDPKYLLLVTDGDPDTCTDPNPGSPRALAQAQQHSIQAVQAAYASQVGVLVMSVAKDVAPVHLQALANAGAGKDPAAAGADAARYYVASDSSVELAGQLSGILAGVRTCNFTLMGRVTDGGAADGTVTLDDQPLALNDPNGYRLNGPSELEILGAACEKIKADSQKLEVSFPCGAFEPH